MSPTKARWVTAVVFASLGYLYASANDGTPIVAAAICALVGYFFRAILAIIVAVALMALVATGFFRLPQTMAY